MPIPSSLTTSRALTASAVSVTWVAVLPKRAAFDSRLLSTWVRRLSSPSTHTACGRLLDTGWSATAATAWRTTSARLSGCTSICNLPEMMRETSSRSSTRRRR
ncbi:hypothetical protein DUPY_50450 [Duganella phyllosphaerae]|uniref:Uncharacterized protein n=1 Tax=Duganella phyllosphaerae TaxID=762836 RepID=A0A1E7W627_9BURK|nr:hypothetical protein DUPY_50450 [Duganella phyllosphaerae]